MESGQRYGYRSSGEDPLQVAEDLHHALRSRTDALCPRFSSNASARAVTKLTRYTISSGTRSTTRPPSTDHTVEASEPIR